MTCSVRVSRENLVGDDYVVAEPQVVEAEFLSPHGQGHQDIRLGHVP